MNMELNLDEALNFEELDNLDLSDVVNVGEVNTTIEAPHIKLNTKTFREALSSIGVVSSLSGRDVISRSLLFKCEGDKVNIYATDFDTYLRWTIENETKENSYQGSFIIPYDILMKLMKAVPSVTVISFEDNQFYLHLMGGKIVISTLTLDVDKYSHPKADTPVGRINSVDLYKGIRAQAPLVISAVSPQEKRIMFTEGKMLATHLFALIEANGFDFNFDLHIKNIRFLTSAIKAIDEDLSLYQGVGEDGIAWVSVHCSKFIYTFIISEPTYNEMFKDIKASFKQDSHLLIDFLQLYKMTELAAELPYSTGRIEMNIIDGTLLHFSIGTRKEAPADFRIEGSTQALIPSLKKNITVQAKLFKLLLSGFAGSSQVALSFSDIGLRVCSDTYQAYLIADPV